MRKCDKQRSLDGGSSSSKGFRWQQQGVHLAVAPWMRDPERQQFVPTSVKVSEETVPQYALVFDIAVMPSSHMATGRKQHVIRRITKPQMANAFERAVRKGHENHDFASLKTRESSSTTTDSGDGIDAAVHRWLLRGNAAPSREELVLWLLSRMILVRNEVDLTETPWTLAICGDEGVELAVESPPMLVGKERPVHQAHDEKIASSNIVTKPDGCAEGRDREDGEDEQLPQYEDSFCAKATPLVDSDEDEERDRSSDADLMDDDTGGDEHAAPESPGFMASAKPKARLLPECNMATLESYKKTILSASTSATRPGSSSRASNSSQCQSSEPQDARPEPQGWNEPSPENERAPAKSEFTFEPTSTRTRRSSSSTRSSALDPDLTNEWTQDRRLFQLELHKSKRDIQVATHLQKKTEAIAHLRRQQFLNQSQRKLRAHDQKRDDSRQVTQLISDTLEYHEILQTLEQQVKRTKISAKREEERLTQTMRVALRRSGAHKKGPVWGSGPLSQRELDALQLQARTGDRQQQEEADDFVYDLHGRRHFSADAGSVVALGVFESAMKKIKRVFLERNDRTNGGGCDLMQCFRSFDTNRSGTLDRIEFQRALETQGVVFTDEQARVFFEHFDRNKSSEIDYGELLWGFFNRKAFLKKWEHKKTKLSSQEIKLLFYQYDRTGRGALSLRDFQLAMDNIGFPLSEHEATLLALKFDANQDGFIDYHEFHAFVNNEEEDSAIAIADERGGSGQPTIAQTRSDESRRRKSIQASTQQQRRESQGEDESVEKILEELRALSETQMKIRRSMRK